ncbi:hypothetical protein SEA_MADIBA_47 [Mycobacterium phage Madiba]|nr:hypothetical protein SEA_MADIBA_47 [Mycobacterium phage Madiba]
MNLTEYERWMLGMLLSHRTRTVLSVEVRHKVNPPGSASPEVRAERAKQKAAAKRKKAQRKAGRR